jgi:sigma-E factor negative regulatory protein RseC
MLEQTARVVTTAPDGAWVEAVEPSGCGTCGGHGCSSRRIAELFQRRPRQFPVHSDFELAPGDRVVVGIADGSVLKGALRLYGAPLVLMLAGASLAQWLWGADSAALVGMVAGGVAGWLFARGGHVQRPVVLRLEGKNLFRMEKGCS